VAAPALASEVVSARVLVIDNYDSFVYNLVQELGELGANPVVLRNDAITVAEIAADLPDLIVISPGPGRPSSAGISRDIISELTGHLPILGVCLGHQCIGEVFGGEVVKAPTLMHGKSSAIEHDGKGLFAGVPSPMIANRYHSLVVDPASVPDVLEVSARTADGIIMGLKHRSAPTFGLQFHPESILSPDGPRLLENFLALAKA
jgi:anthranilate synthase/aminodeoxychorismate synthase-like glutamine amidotransferase